MLCVSFSSRSEAIIVFSKHILKSKTRGQSIQANKKLFYHVIVKNYLCNVSIRFLIKIKSTWRREIKEQAPQLTLLYRGRTVRSSHRSCCIRKLFLKILQYLQEALVLESTFKKVADLQTCNLIKKRPNTGVSCEYGKIFNTILKNICKRLLFNLFSSGLLLHGAKGLRSRLYDSFRVQVTVLGFVLSRHLSFRSNSQLAFENLRQIPLINRISFYIACFWSFQMVSGRFRWFQAVLGHFQIVLDRYRSFQIILGCFSSFLALVSTIFFKKWKLETVSEKTFLENSC